MPLDSSSSMDGFLNSGNNSFKRLRVAQENIRYEEERKYLLDQLKNPGRYIFPGTVMSKKRISAIKTELMEKELLHKVFNEPDGQAKEQHLKILDEQAARKRLAEEVKDPTKNIMVVPGR